TTPIKSAVACIGFGPYDYQSTNVQIGGSQEPLFDLHFADGAYAPMPAQGIIVWNSHAFNLTDTPTTNEQYLNMNFARQDHQEQPYLVQGLFDSTEIFWNGDNVPPFQQKEFCWTHRFPDNTHLFYLSSHYHKRGKRFRIWGAPQASCTTLATCLPDPRA